VNKRRLLKLAALLDRVPDEKFDMGTWGTSGRLIKNAPQCATKACALGWATAIPEFYKAGLELRAYAGARHANVYFNGRENVSAGAQFFDIEWSDADDLFMGGCEGPKEKAAEIRALVQAHK
jgi:hypothetical protein